jgi:hypothetical protein
VGHDRSQHRHPELRSLELGLRRWGLPFHTPGSVAAACGRESDGVECEAVVEFDVFGREEEFGVADWVGLMGWRENG